MSVTRPSRRESRRDMSVSHGDVTPVVTVPPTRPDPTHNYYRPKAASMTSGRGWPSTGRDHHQAVSASVMDGHFVASDGGA